MGPVLAVSGHSLGLCWRSWVALGAYMGGLGPKNAKNMATLMATFKIYLFLEREHDLRPGGRSGAALGAYVVGLGPLLEPMLAVLGRSWSLCWRSWAARRAYVGSPGRSWAALVAFVGGPGPFWLESGPNPSGRAIQEA